MENNYTKKEEFFNSLSHFLGVIFAIVALILMVVHTSSNGSVLSVVSTAIFGTGMIVLYSASTLYHWFSEPKLKRKLRLFDHIAIYVLIAATYTPICLLGLKGAWGWSLFGTVWALALLGTIYKLSGIKNDKISLILYLAMGWLIVVAIKPFIDSLNAGTIYMILAGGIFYSLGTIFYRKESIPYNHAIWHLFVLGGTICHFIGIYVFLI